MRRSVQFWRLTNSDGTELAHQFPAAEVLGCLANAEVAGLDRHRHCRDGMVLIAHAAHSPAFPTMTLDKVRRENLPSVGDSVGKRRPIGLTPDEGLLEPTYCAFTPNNVIAILISGNGPRPQRLADYFGAKFNLSIGLTPVLTRNLDQVLREMRVTSVEVTIPAHRVDRDLVGGDWVYALDAGRQLSEDGLVKVGFSVGRSGTKDEKRRLSERFRGLVNQLRGSGGLSEFQSARVAGSLNGAPRTVDLLHDKFVEQVDVDPDIWNDPERSVEYAQEILEREIAANYIYLEETNPHVPNTPTEFMGRLIEIPDDERR